MLTVYAAVLAAQESPHNSNPLWPPLNGELLWALVSFVVLFIIVSKVAFPSLRKTLAERTANIEGKLAQAQHEYEQAQALLHEYEQRLAQAGAETRRMIEHARDNADRLEAELRAHAEDQARRIVERAQATIAAERDRAIQELRTEVGTLAIELASRVIGESLDNERQLRLVDQYIQELQSS